MKDFLKKSSLEIVHPKIESYLSDLFVEKDPLHEEMEKFASQKKFKIGRRSISFPIIGKLVGRSIFQLARLTRAKRILELGSGFGYSAYWFARAIGNEGELILTDGSKENLDQAQSFLSRIPARPEIHYKEGNALDILDEVPGEFDIIFNDINKDQYPAAFRKASPRIRKGGLFIADNVLWSGEVLSPKKADASAKGIIEFNRLISQDPSFISTIIPLRDGLSVSLKI